MSRFSPPGSRSIEPKSHAMPLARSCVWNAHTLSRRSARYRPLARNTPGAPAPSSATRQVLEARSISRVRNSRRSCLDRYTDAQAHEKRGLRPVRRTVTTPIQRDQTLSLGVYVTRIIFAQELEKLKRCTYERFLRSFSPDDTKTQSI